MLSFVVIYLRSAHFACTLNMPYQGSENVTILYFNPVIFRHPEALLSSGGQLFCEAKAPRSHLRVAIGLNLDIC
jgi:hypothetical protein